MILMIVIIVTLLVISGLKKYELGIIKREFTDFVEFKETVRYNDLFGV